MTPGLPPRGGQATQPTAAQPTDGRDDIGCATWTVGAALLAVLIALVWLGFHLSPRLADLGGAGAASTEPATSLAPIDEAAGRPPGGEAPANADQASVETVPPIAPAAESAVVPVPDLIGLGIDAATDAVTARGLLLSEAGETFSDSVPAGAVAGQDPPPETGVTQGEVVFVTISAGSGRVDLQALQLPGRTVDEAVALLQERGLDVEQAEAASPDVAPGLVAGVEPESGARIGDTVTLLVSVGDRVRIPGELQGQPIDQVERQLAQLGLRVGARFPVGRATIEGFGLDLATAAIEDQDVVGVQGQGVALEAWVPPGTEVDLVYYDRAQDQD